MKSRNKKFFRPVYDNDLDAYNPELWANESLQILVENLVIANIVHRDFEDQIQDFGDVVNVQKPGEFSAKRKGADDDVIIQDAKGGNVAVKLDQHWHTAFMIKDSEQTKSFKDLVAEYLSPALISIAQAIDKALLGQYPQFLSNISGKIGGLDNTNVRTYILSGRKAQNDLKVPVVGRYGLIGSQTEATFLDTDLFTNADKVGDDGTALRDASVGRKLGYNWFMSQNVGNVVKANTTNTVGEVNNASGYPVGTTTMTVDGFSAAIVDGSFFTTEGDDTPQRVVSTVGGATPTSITFSPGLKSAVIDDADVTIYEPCQVDLPAGYALDYVKEIHVDGFLAGHEPQVGQMVSDGTNDYVILEVTGSGTEVDILLDRPLAAALADGDNLSLGPAGEYNMLIRNNALALVTRPLALPIEGVGALSSVVNFEGISVRVVLSYHGVKQGLLVTVDILGGVKVLDSDQGAVLLA